VTFYRSFPLPFVHPFGQTLGFPPDVQCEAKYKSKNSIDTVVFRGGDAASGWVYAALKGLGLGLAGVAAAAIPGAILWLALGLWLGRRQRRLQAGGR
jgi:AAA family ATP:ADP antiporter